MGWPWQAKSTLWYFDHMAGFTTQNAGPPCHYYFSFNNAMGLTVIVILAANGLSMAKSTTLKRLLPQLKKMAQKFGRFRARAIGLIQFTSISKNFVSYPAMA